MVPVMDSIEVGARIAARRKGKGLTQKQLAELLHITDKAVSKWECGKNFPDLTVLEPLASALDTSPSDLLGLNENNSAELLSATTEIYQEQRRRWLKALRNRAWLSLVYCILVFAGWTWIGRYLNNKTLYEPPQLLITGMSGLFGGLTGSALWTLRSTVKQLKKLQCMIINQQGTLPQQSAVFLYWKKLPIALSYYHPYKWASSNITTAT